MSKSKRKSWRMNTPRWWRNLVTSRPLRRQFQAQARRAVTSQVADLEDLQEEQDPPNRLREYYW